MKRLVVFIEDDVPAILLAVMVVVLGAEVFSRYLLSRSILGASEIAELCFVWLVYLSAIGVLRRRRHIAVDALRVRLGARGQALLDCLTNAIMAGTLGLLLLRAWTFVSRTNFSPLPATGLSRRVLAVAVLVGVAGMLVHVLLHLVAALRGAGSDSYSAEPESLGELDDIEQGKGTAL